MSRLRGLYLKLVDVFEPDECLSDTRFLHFICSDVWPEGNGLGFGHEPGYNNGRCNSYDSLPKADGVLALQHSFQYFFCHFSVLFGVLHSINYELEVSLDGDDHRFKLSVHRFHHL